MDKNFGGVIWTNHALQRLRERGIKQGDALATWRNPDQSRHGAAQGAWVYYKTYGDKKIEVVASKNQKGETVILSVWERPLYYSEERRSRGGNAWDNLLEKFLRFVFRRK